MPEESKGGVFDSIVESIAGGVEHIWEPEEKTFWHTITHEWLSISAWVHYVGEKGVSRGMFLIFLYIPLIITAAVMLPQLPRLIGGWLLLGAPVILPVGMWIAFWSSWMWYIQSLYIFNRTNPILLEVRMPTEITKSPRAMEQVLTSFWIRSGTTTRIDTDWYGGVTPYSSLEICSFGGEIHFFIWIRKGYKNVIEAAMYAQYPEVEIVEVPDYAIAFEYDPQKHHCFVTDYIFDPPERGDKYPIKSYIDFELDKDPKEELKVEPYASVLEVLSALNKDEQAWIQIVFKGYFKQDWQKTVIAEVDKIRDSASKGINLLIGEAPADDDVGFPRPTQLQRTQMDTMERHISKLIFECGLRGIYIAPAGKMRSAEYTAVRWIWRPFNNPNFMTQLRPRMAHNDFDWPWQDWGQGPDGVRWQLWTRRWFDMYRRRQFFHSPWHIRENSIHLSTETLATLWHPPSATIQSPGLQRIPTSKAEAPPNLPM